MNEDTMNLISLVVSSIFLGGAVYACLLFLAGDTPTPLDHAQSDVPVCDGTLRHLTLKVHPGAEHRQAYASVFAERGWTNVTWQPGGWTATMEADCLA